MKKIKKILFPTDFSIGAQNAFLYALELAAKINAQIEVLHVVFPQAEVTEYPVLLAPATETRVEVSETVLESFVKNGQLSLEKKEIILPIIISSIEIGTPVRTIVKVARRADVDCIVMGTQGQRSGMDRWLGSVASGVVEKSECSVLVIPQNTLFKRIDTLVYASNFQKADPFEIWKATDWLSPFGMIVHCVHVNLNNKEEEIDFTELQEFFDNRPPNLQIKFYQLAGKTFKESITDFLEQIDADMLVMYQSQRSFLAQLFHKSQTKQMAYYNRIPMMVMK